MQRRAALSWNQFRGRIAGLGCSPTEVSRRWRLYKENPAYPGVFAPCRTLAAVQPDQTPAEAGPIQMFPPELLVEMAINAPSPQVARSLCLASRATVAACRAQSDAMSQLVWRFFPDFARLVLESLRPFEAFLWLTSIPLFAEMQQRLDANEWIAFRAIVDDDDTKLVAWNMRGFEFNFGWSPEGSDVYRPSDPEIGTTPLDVRRAIFGRDGLTQFPIDIHVGRERLGRITATHVQYGARVDAPRVPRLPPPRKQ